MHQSYLWLSFSLFDKQEMKLVFVFLCFATCCIADIAYKDCSVAESTSTSTALTTKASVTFTCDSDMHYKITWAGEIHASTLASHVNVEMDLDGACHGKQDYHPDPDGAPGWGPTMGMAIVQPGAGPHTFRVQFSSSGEGHEVKMRNTCIVVEAINFG